MSAEFAGTEWGRARDARRDAELLLLNGSSEGAASRAYYAAFHAVTALFALEDREFSKHSALEAAVHRDLVKTGRWPPELGRDYRFCLELRGSSDYGSDLRVDATQAGEALEAARRILTAVRNGLPDDYPPA